MKLLFCNFYEQITTITVIGLTYEEINVLTLHKHYFIWK